MVFRGSMLIARFLHYAHAREFIAWFLSETLRAPRGGMEARALLGLYDRYYLLTEILGRADMMWHGGPDLWARDQSGRNRAGKPVQRQLARLAVGVGVSRPRASWLQPARLAQTTSGSHGLVTSGT